MTAVQLRATNVLDRPTESQKLCCNQATVCSSCGRVICFEHTDPSPVTCENAGVVCAECHESCTSIPCAREHADPDL